jgi:dipeptidyl aminopeptidase/acylaminoacyl peptidase
MNPFFGVARAAVRTIACAVVGLFLVAPLVAQAPPGPDVRDLVQQMNQRFEELGHRLDQLEKAVDDVAWYQRVGDIATVEKVRIYGPPRAKVPNPTAMGAKNPLTFWAYIFVPNKLDRAKKHPLIVFPHGGVHADLNSQFSHHIIRELLTQGYVVVAPEYRGSTGYGGGFYRTIDYGALENEDVYASKNHVLENYDFVDKNRVGIMGWSHGGMITLMNIFEHPDDYKVAFAGVPVSDLVARMGYSTEEYRQLFSAPYHIGKTAEQDVNEYRRRSPVNNVSKLRTPLLVHTNTNDDDVYVLEVEHLIEALKAAGKKFDYEVFQEMPGGHSFDRLDTRAAKQIRLKIYKFLADYLQPPTQFKTVEELTRAGSHTAAP